MIDAQLKWHVHPREIAGRNSSAARQIVDTKFRSAYQVYDPIEPSRGVVSIFCRKPGNEAEKDDAKRNRLKRGCIFTVKRTVDEY